MSLSDWSSFEAGADSHALSADADGRFSDSAHPRRPELSEEGNDARPADQRAAVEYCVSNDLV